MQIKNLNCKNFRNLKNIEIFPDSQMNVICGENAQGKTNILEAIWLFTGAKSFRFSKDNAFVNFDKEKAKNEITFISGGVENKAQIIFSDNKEAFLNDKKLSNTAKLSGNFNAVIFEPNDLSIIKEGPEKRRRFLDICIGQLYPKYIDILRDYHRAVLQRNKIIKEYKYDPTVSVMLDIFEEKIASNGTKIREYRKKYLLNQKDYLIDIYSGLSEKREKISAEYVYNDEDISLGLINSRREDMYSSVTSVGPHRDDIEFKINGNNVRNFGSQGQKRSVALALKFAQAEIIKEQTGEYPVFLLDDVMSELDVKRQNFVLNHINGWQSFITCCDPSSVERLKKGKIFEVKNGEIL